MGLSSRSPVAKAAARSLLNTTTRLQRPFHRFQLVKNDHALQLNLKTTESEDNSESSESLESIARGLKRLEAKLDKLGTHTHSAPQNGAREEEMAPESMELFPPQKGGGARRRSRKEEDDNAKKDSETAEFNGSDYESDSQNDPKKDINDESSQELTDSLPLQAPDSGEESGGEDMEEEETEMERSYEVIPSKIRRLEEPPIIISQSSYKFDKEDEEKKESELEQVEPNEEVKRLMAMFDPSKT